MFLAIDNYNVEAFESVPDWIMKWFHVSFFSGFMVISYLFLINLFVGVIIDNFNKIKASNEVGGAFVTPK